MNRIFSSDKHLERMLRGLIKVKGYMSGKKRKWLSCGAILTILLLCPISMISNPRTFEEDSSRRALMGSMRLLRHYIPDSLMFLSDSLYRFEGTPFTGLIDEKTTRQIREYYSDTHAPLETPEYREYLHELRENLKFSEEADKSVKCEVRLSEPYKGMISCEVISTGLDSLNSVINGGRVSILFRWDIKDGNVVQMIKLSKPISEETL